MDNRINEISATLKVAYAKNPIHERFIQAFQGKLKGRYLIAFFVGVEYLGGGALRQQIERELGQPHYGPDQWVDARHMVIMFDRAVRAGASVERIGELVMPAYKRAHPEAFVGRTIFDAFEILERGYRQDTTYGGVASVPELSPGRVRVFRSNSPLPCQYFVGVIKGLLQCFDSIGSVQETRCQWEGHDRCCFETRWNAVLTPLPTVS
jgi:hypothetical protein